MSLEVGRVGVRPDQLDNYGRINPKSQFIQNLLNDLPVWTDLPVWKSGTEQLLPVNYDEPDTSPILCDIEYPVADLKNNQYFTYRQSPTQKDGKAKIRGIRGKTLVWNQLCKTLASGNWATVAVGTGTLTFADGVATFSTSQNFGRFLYTPGNLVNGHKYLLSIEIKAYENATINYALGSQGSYASQGCVCSTESASDANWHRYTSVGTFTSGTDDKVLVQNNSGVSNLHEIQVRNIMYFDLTQMGLDSITSASEFISLFPLPFYVRNTGSLLDFTGTKVKTTNSNLGLFPTGRTNNGVTFTCNGSVMTIKGKATANATPWGTNVSTQYASMPIGPLPAGVYTITTKGFVGVATNDRIIANGIYNDGSNAFSDIRISGKPSEIADGSGRSYTVTCSKPFKMGFYCQVLNGGTFDCEVKLMVNAGSTALPYVDHDTNETDLPISTFFPTGMKSAGTVYDELTPTRAITRVGAVDLGSLTWTYSSSEGHLRFTSTGINTLAKKAPNASTKANALCSKYEIGTENDVYNNNKQCLSITSAGNITVYDTTYNSADSFKTAMSGVMLNYELAVEDVQPTMSFGD